MVLATTACVYVAYTCTHVFRIPVGVLTRVYIMMCLNVIGTYVLRTRYYNTVRSSAQCRGERCVRARDAFVYYACVPDNVIV